MDNNNQVENGNASQGLIVGWFRGQDLTLQLLMGLCGIGPIIFAIGLAINQMRGAENWHSWFVGEDNQFWIWFQDLELMYIAAFLTYLAIYGIYCYTKYLFFERFLASESNLRRCTGYWDISLLSESEYLP